MEEALSGIFLHVSCAAGINFKVKKKNLSEASLLHLSTFPCGSKRVEVQAELFTRLAKVPHHREPRNLSQKISSGTSGDRLKGKHCEFRGAQKSLRAGTSPTEQSPWTGFGSAT